MLPQSFHYDSRKKNCSTVTSSIGIVVRGSFPNAYHVVGRHCYDVHSVVRGGYFVNNNVVAIQRYFARVFQVVVLQFRPRQPRRRVHHLFQSWRTVFPELRNVV